MSFQGFCAKLALYDDRTNFFLPEKARDLGPLEVESFNPRTRTMVIRQGGRRRRGTKVKGGFLRYQYTRPNPPKTLGTYDVIGRVEGDKIILAPFLMHALKSAQEVFGE